jgi:hypothetical protein
MPVWPQHGAAMIREPIVCPNVLDIAGPVFPDIRLRALLALTEKAVSHCAVCVELRSRLFLLALKADF